MSAAVVLNRIVWLLLFASVVAWAAGHWWLSRPAAPAERPAPLAVPKVEVGPLAARMAASFPAHNAFAADGENWRAAPPAARRQGTDVSPRPDATDVRGIVRFGAFAGALTPEGFVPEGGVLKGSTVSEITDAGVRLRRDNEDEIRLLATDRAPVNKSLATGIRIQTVD